MNLLDPEAGGRLRALLTISASAFAAIAAAAGVAEQVWAVSVLIVLAAVQSVIQVLTHTTDIGNV